MNMRKIVAALAILSLLSTAIGGYLFYHSARESAVKEAEREFVAMSRGIKAHILRLFFAHQKETAALARFEEFQEALMDGSPEKLTQANRILDHFAGGLSYDVCYLLDADGNAISASNRDRVDSFLGKNYSKRPYFLEAIKGKSNAFMAVGATSGKRGVYFAHPVYRKDWEGPIGVTVVKASLDHLERQIVAESDETVMLVHSYGVILVSNRSDWLLKLLWQASAEDLSKIADSELFGKGPWEWTGLEMKGRDHAVDGAGEIYVIRELALEDCPGWKLVCLSSRKAMFRKLVDPLMGNTGPIALILCVFVGGAVFALYDMAQKDIRIRQRAERALQESEAGYRSIFDSMNDAIFVHDVETGQIVDVNRKMSDMYGYTCDEASSLSVGQISLGESPYSQEDALRWMSRAAHVEPQLFEWLAKDRTGRLFWIEVNLKKALIRGKDRLLAVVRDITERKKFENALRQSEERYKALYDDNPSMYFTIDAEGTVLSVNKFGSQELGYRVEELVGQTVLKVFYPDDREAAREQFAVCLRNPMQAYRHESRKIRKDGSMLWVEETARAVESPAGNPVILVVCKDISERKHAEEALKDSEEKLKATVCGSPIPQFVIDQNHRVIYWNRALEQISDIKAGEIIGTKEHWRAFYDSERPCMADLLVDEKHELISYWYGAKFCKSGLVDEAYECADFIPKVGPGGKWLHLTAAAIRDSKGNIVGAVETIEDITDRKKAEEDRVRLVTAIGQAAESFVVTDKDWIVEYVNPALERITGYEASEIIGRHMRILEYDKHDKTLYKGIQAVLNRGDTWSGRLTNRKKDGASYEAEVTTSPVRDNSGKVVNYVSIQRDITHEVKLEKELRQAQKMEAIGTLAGGIAHDFNNILMAVSGYTELAYAKCPEGDPVRRHLDQVRVASSRAKDLVTQILTFSRNTEQARKPMSVDPIVKEALKLLRSSLPSTIEIRQEIEVPPDGCLVLTDPTQIHQVVMNLCANAAHAMRAKGGLLTVGLSCEPVDAQFLATFPGLRPGPYLCLTVKDTGHGMDASIGERIFDPYFTTKGPGEGTGLGLAVVQGIVKSHVGAVTVHSELGQGTTFRVFLPKAEEEISVRVEPVEALPVGSERILFVDDEKVLVDLGKEMLEGLGYRVTATTGGLEALEIFRAQPTAFDLVITDMTMPDITGRYLARELLAIRPDIPVILCSGLSEPVDGKPANLVGISAFVMKPYEISRVAKIIREVLEAE
jgi:PAS domain S-box-containing protein